MPANEALAVRYFKLAADQGEIHALQAYASCLYEGMDIARDPPFSPLHETGGRSGQFLWPGPIWVHAADR
jgi:TPR repeat protein